jgi:ribonuclease G
MVYAPTGEGVGVSRRLEDAERERLRKEVKGLDLHGGGAIVRTAAHGARREAFERELLYLDKLNEVLSKRVADASAPALVFQEADLSIRVVRDIFSAHFERAVVDDEKQHQRLVSFFTRTAPELVDRVELWNPSAPPLFEAFGVDDVIEGMLTRRVDLPSGGYLVIDYAEALTVIDVNSGSFIGRGKQARLEDTITKTNLEAADEVVNQLRLRDIGGIIVIDFIDMARARNRDAVLKVLRKALDEDRTKTFVVEISPLGLVEMTRQNVTDGVREIMTRACPTCDGEGVIKSEETIAIEVERRLRELVKEAGEDGPQAYLIRINPRVTAQFIGNGSWLLRELEEETGRYFHFEGSEGLPLDHFAVTLEGTREEVAEQAVPFREGEEVHVDIVEPHMYEIDDAVAKLDGYIISVAGAGRFVGQKRLVRIDEAGRTSATAALIDVTDEERAAMEAETARAPGASASGRARRAGRGRGATSRRRSTGAARAGLAEQAEAATTDDDQGADPVDEPAASESAPERLSGVAEEEADASVSAPDDSSLPEPESDPDGDVLESKSRRRGRRGGRRRSRAKTDEADAAATSPDPTD